MTKTGPWLIAHVSHDSEECLIWPYGRDSGGYARAWLSGFNTRLAHRIMCELAHGEPPSIDHVARHTCGNGHLGCVNPTHICWGTVVDNILDRDMHGTTAMGERMGCSVLTEDSVRRIRRLASSGELQRVIARKFGVSNGTVQAVISGRTWRHVR